MKLTAMYGVSGVEIEGTADTLRQFSQEIQELDGSRRIHIDFLVEAKRETPANSDHIHIEYFPGDFPFLAAMAEPLIVTNSDLSIASHSFSSFVKRNT